MGHPRPAISHRPLIHPWLSPTLVTRYVTALGDRFAARDPARAGTITANAQTLRGRIQRVIDQYKPRLAQAPRKKLVTFHDAFDALAHDMGLTVVAHLVPPSPTPGSEPTANRLTQAIEKIRELHLSVIYSEPQFPAHAVEAIRAETGAAVLSLDPLGRAGEHYQDLLGRNLETLVKGQGERR